MLKKLAATVIVISFSICSSALVVKTGRPGPDAPVSLKEASAEKCVIRFELGSFEIKNIETENGKFTAVAALSGDRTSEVGKPDLPSTTSLVEIPYNAVPKLSMTDVSYQEYDLGAMGFDSPVNPRQAPLVKLPGAERAFAMDVDLYGSDCFFPQEPVQVQKEAFIRSHRVLPVTINPFQYNPARNVLRVYNSFDLTVETTGASYSSSISEFNRTASSSYESYLKERIINYRGIYGSSPKTSYGDGLLIITPPSLNTSDLQNYAELKRKWGYKVQVATLTETGTTAAAIQSYIQNAYNTWTNPPLGFVMLVGAYELIAATNMTQGDSATKTDLYYSTVSGGDILPDVHLARLTVNNTAELSTVLSRLTSYSLGSFSTTSWIDRISFLGTCDTGFYTIAEGTHNYCVSNYTSPWGYTGNFPSNPQAGGDKLYCVTYSAGDDDCIDRFNEGRSVVTHSGHCGPTYFAGPYIYVSDVQGLTNGEKTPFVVGHCCQSNQWESSSLTVGEAWLKKAAVGYWGSVDYTYWDEDDLLQKYWYKEVFTNGNYKVGVFTDLAKIDFFNNPGGSSAVTYYLEEYNLNGDPTLEIWTRQPSAMSVSHAGEMFIGTASFPVTVTSGGAPVAGALVCLYKADEGIHEVALTDACGAASLTMSPSPANIGTISLMVTKHDLAPYQAAVNVVAANGPYFVYSSHGALTEVEGDGDSYLERGEKWSVSVSMGNIGTEGATGAVATLSGNGIEVCVPSRSFGNISVGGTGSATFEFVISEGFAPCGGEVVFGLISKACAESSPAGSDESGLFTLAVGQLTAGQATDLVIQPSPSDTHIAQDASGTNYGTSSTMHVQRLTNAGRRALVQFDLSGIPQGSMINSAQLELYCTSPSSVSQTLNLHNVNASWTETGATWSNMNSKYDGTVLSSRTGGTAMGWKSWTGLSGLVQDWIDGDIPNYGVMVKTSVETGTTAYAYQFASSEHGTAANRPILRVNYTPPDVWDCAYSGGSECDALFAPSGEVAETEVTPTGFGWNATDAQSYRVLRGVQSNLPALETADADFSCYSFGAATSVNISADDPSGEPGMCYYYLVQGYNGPDPDMYFGPAGNSTAGPRVINTQSACD
ncbi:MAG TPA: C25 family cysteine peptidase [Acidobacteriota bacterium]|nr:C25 family cysteine peptidase [Acidobacteriota bacterium]